MKCQESLYKYILPCLCSQGWPGKARLEQTSSFVYMFTGWLSPTNIFDGWPFLTDKMKGGFGLSSLLKFCLNSVFNFSSPAVVHSAALRWKPQNFERSTSYLRCQQNQDFVNKQMLILALAKISKGEKSCRSSWSRCIVFVIHICEARSNISWCKYFAFRRRAESWGRGLDSTATDTDKENVGTSRMFTTWSCLICGENKGFKNRSLFFLVGMGKEGGGIRLAKTVCVAVVSL